MTTGKKRGGRRPGAGRKPTLAYRQRMTVGGYCQRLWRERVRANQEAALKKATRNVRGQQRKAQNKAVSIRSIWLDVYGETHEKDVEDALRRDQKLEAGDQPSRIITVSAKLPKGKTGQSVRQEIIAQAAEKFGISKRMAETCWKEFRAFERDAD